LLKERKKKDRAIDNIENNRHAEGTWCVRV